ncbi:MAG: ATP-dependent RecD-like DNA helicase [Verrucomicrobia subdivision 3 bacterium]|nr:ATP-dependent RecD-like DNA helicase [Limisphaerales bacterium]MCS1417311.1 ATP-dependent RecD-like DNA helicase [Limisphaerales bacterium]
MTDAQSSALPADLKLISLKFANDCYRCGTEVAVGERAHWSPSSSLVWCQSCVLALSTTDQDEIKADSAQGQWGRLCRYLSKGVLAEMADTLVKYRSVGKWFLHPATTESLVVGESDQIAIPSAVSRRVSNTGRQPAFIYGWPTLLALNQRRQPMITPLFMVSVLPEYQDGWVGHAESEPEFNISVVAGELFDGAMKEEIDEVVGEGLPFGDGAALVQMADMIASVLGVQTIDDLDPKCLSQKCNSALGLHNLAIWVMADGVSKTSLAPLHDELEKLAHRKDWMKTAAALLLPFGAEASRKDRRFSTEPLAAPFPCNDSQKATLESFRREPLTVVTGPPGTGKTQLVVNAVANAWLDDEETVLVTSTNNGAVDVAVDRANALCPGMLLRTGNKDMRQALAGQAMAALTAAGTVPEDGLDLVNEQSRARMKLAQAVKRRGELSEDMDKVAALSRELSATVEALEKSARSIWNQARAPDLDHEQVQRKTRIWWFRRRRGRKYLKSIGCENPDVFLGDLARWLEIDRKRAALMDDLATTEEQIGDADAKLRETGEQWLAASQAAAVGTIRAGLRSGRSNLQSLERVNPGGGKPFAAALRSCLSDARGWACTSLSMQRSFPLEPGLFDLTIIDEASQCSLAVALPLAYRSKRLAVVGDPHQLSPICRLEDGRLRTIAESEDLDEYELSKRGIHYKEGSTYRAFESVVERDGKRPIILDEHYRSHPYIARWFNREFYANALTVLTDTSKMPVDERSICWVDVTGEAVRGESGSWTNRAEADAAVQILADKIQHTGSVGVVTPFAAQARLIDRLTRRQLSAEILQEARFACGTAHRFQGDERDMMVFSSVLAPGVAERTAAWVERDRNLINVAVSRARSSLLVLGHPNVPGSPTLASLRSYLIEATEGENVQSATAKFRTDSQSEARLLEAMRSAGLQPSAKLFVGGYELDFALLEDGMRVNVEVDGGHHTDARGKLRRQDIVRDRILSSLGWKVIRVPAWRCFWDADSAVSSIVEQLTGRHAQTAQGVADCGPV